jgi:lipopolysaccharide/colanic/teichoic acid biosynthesis glycosyltransferase
MENQSFTIPADWRAFGGSGGIPGWKRFLDLALILLALPFVAPLMFLIALGIKLVSRGPILYRQERVGYLGRQFTMVKFRSMKIDARTSAHQDYCQQLIRSDAPMTKMDLIGDERLIPLGSLLRSTGLDELPQIFNVLRGEMSLVGPRPGTPYEYESYSPWHKQRLSTLPGLTGLWQVSGKNKTNFTQMVNLDIYYARNQSVTLDLTIMAKTLPALAGQVKELLDNRRQKHEKNGSA